MKTVAKIGMFCAVTGFLWVSPFIIVPKLHDAQLNRLQHEIAIIPLPRLSKSLARHGEIGNFGNGNHIDYWAIELRSITGARSVLKTSYDNVRVPVPNAADDDYDRVSGGKQPIEWQLLPSPLPARFHLWMGVGNTYAWDLSRFAEQQGLYIVQVVNSGENDDAASIFDWRGI